MPIIAAIGLGIVGVILGFIPFLVCLVGIPIFLVNIGILGWAGFKAAKEDGMDVTGGAVTGLVTGIVSSLVVGIINLVLALLGVGAVGALSNSGAGNTVLNAGITGVAGIIGIVFGVGFWAVVGALAGAGGAYYANNMSKGTPAPAPKK